MPRDTKFDADKLRKLINEKKSANEICQELGIPKTILNNHHLKLMRKDRTFYDIPGLSERIVIPKVKKTGVTIPLDKLNECGFVVGDNILFEKQEDGVLIVKKQA
jgi:hypothetical protein